MYVVVWGGAGQYRAGQAAGGHLVATIERVQIGKLQGGEAGAADEGGQAAHADTG